MMRVRCPKDERGLTDPTQALRFLRTGGNAAVQAWRRAIPVDLGLDFAAAGPIVANDEPDSHYEESVYNGR
jgi:hypothetical protein